VTALAVWDFLQAAPMLLMGAVMAVAGQDPDLGRLFSLAMSAVYLLLGVAHVAAGIGLLKLRNWGRILQIVLSCIGLLGIPCGTLISIFILVYLLKPGIAILFSGRTDELTPEEAAEVARALQSNAAMWAIVAVVGGLMAVAIIGIIAAIAIPSLLRARISANEAGALGNLRTVISAEAAFESTVGAYATVPCLQQPQACVTDWQGGTLLHENIVFDVARSGYVLRFHPGEPAVGADGAPLSTQQVVGSYAVSAVPATTSTGVRHFCGDSSGMVFIMPAGSVPTEGRCPGQPLR
jgi:type II secretory pathway pseudopilin PulG